FLIENENKEEIFITEDPKSHLEIVSTDWRPVAEIEFTKTRGKDAKPNMTVDLEDFIAVKGIKALGNQLTTDKIKQINLLDSLPFDEPEEVHTEDIEVVDEENISEDEAITQRKSDDSESQTAIEFE